MKAEALQKIDCRFSDYKSWHSLKHLPNILIQIAPARHLRSLERPNEYQRLLSLEMPSQP